MATELIELLLTGGVGTQNQDFEEKFKALLSRTPNTGAPNKAEFFTHFFFSAILILPYTELMKKIGIESICFKPIKKDGQKLKTIKLCFNMEHGKKKRVVLITVTTVKEITNKQHYDIDELKEIITKLKLDTETCEIDEKILHINHKLKDKLTIINKSKSLKNKLKKITLDSNPTQETFLKVEKVESLATNFKAEFSTIAEGLKTITESVKKILGGFVKIYKDQQKDGKSILGGTEAAHHGFVYGALALLFKYQHHMDIHIELTAGARGNADLMFIFRKGGWNATTIIIEFKCGTGASAGIKQIKKCGYAYNVHMRTISQDGIIVGLDFSKDDDDQEQLKIENIKIFQPKGFLPELLKLTENNNDQKYIRKELEHLCYSAGFDNLSKLIFGQILAFQESTKKYIFTHNNKLQYGSGSQTRSGTSYKCNDIIEQSNISTFLLNQNDKWIVLNIIEGSNTDISQSELVTGYIQVNVVVAKDRTIDININNFSIGNATEYNSPDRKKQKPDLKEISGNINLISHLESKQTLEKALGEIIFPHKELITNEKDFQGVLHGLFLAQDSDDRKVRVFIESNISGQGKADVIVSILKKRGDDNYVEDKVIILELKYARNKGEIKEKFNEANEQKQRYANNLKLITDRKGATLLTVIFCDYAQSSNELIITELSSIKESNVVHTSPSQNESQDNAYCSETTESASEDEDTGYRNISSRNSSGYASSLNDSAISLGSSSGYESFLNDSTNSSAHVSSMDITIPRSPGSYEGDDEKTDESLSPRKPYSKPNSSIEQVNIGSEVKLTH